MDRKVHFFAVLIALLTGCSTKIEKDALNRLLHKRPSQGIALAIDRVEVVDYKEAEIKTQLPDFTTYPDVKEKKKAFFEFLRPMVKQENARLRKERKYLIDIFSKRTSKKLSKEEKEWIDHKVEVLRIKNFNLDSATSRQELLVKVDEIPESLFLAQAADESGWGTSRFAREGNNLFGQWCYSKGCGLVPKNRNPGATHEVQRFETVNDAVSSYVTNINRNDAYVPFRKLRAKDRSDGKELSGYQLADGLVKYSERGEAYVHEIKEMILKNNLEPQIENNSK